MDTDGNARKSIPKASVSMSLNATRSNANTARFDAHVLLEIDHIHPVSKGGTNDITNLITACQGCNSGKSDKTLDENTTVAKARTQLQELQEDARDLNDDGVDGGFARYKPNGPRPCCRSLAELAPGFTVNKMVATTCRVARCSALRRSVTG